MSIGITLQNRAAFDAWIDTQAAAEAKADLDKIVGDKAYFATQKYVTQARRAMGLLGGSVPTAKTVELIPAEATIGHTLSGEALGQYLRKMADEVEKHKSITCPETLVKALEPSLVDCWALVGAIDALNTAVEDFSTLVTTINGEAVSRVRGKGDKDAREALVASLKACKELMTVTHESLRLESVRQSHPRPEWKDETKYDDLLSKAEKIDGFSRSKVREMYRQLSSEHVQKLADAVVSLKTSYAEYEKVTTPAPTGLVDF